MTGIYLEDIPLDDALDKFLNVLRENGRWAVLGTEEIPLDENAAGRVLAEPVWARISSPHYHASAMDGFAVRSADTAGAQPGSPLTLTCIFESGSGSARYVDTGDPLPEWADAVIPIEQVEALDADGEIANDPHQPREIRIRAAVAPWSHVRPMGEDIVASQFVLPSGHVLRGVDLGAAIACGHRSLRVARKPRVAILPTGSELIPVGQTPRLGEIIEFNSIVLAAKVNAWGGQAVRFPIIKDDFDEICRQVEQASQNYDLVLLCAGSSAGAEDYSARVVKALGRLLVHGVAVRPGHPVILGIVPSRGAQQGNSDFGPGGDTPSLTPIIGVPGYPVSAALTADIFVLPLLDRWLGRPPQPTATLKAFLTRKVTSPAGDDDYLRVALGRVEGRMLAAPLSRGAGVITSLVRADGLVVIPRGVQGLPAGAEVEVRLIRQAGEVEKTLFAVGSHDLTLDILAQYLAASGVRLVSANVGSLGGLIALRRGEAHFAGSHLLDTETGGYNVSFICHHLPGRRVKVISLVERQQGLMVKRGNPKGIASLLDLARPDIRLVNRQRGAGTRVLLDFHLAKLGIPPHTIQGYDQEEYTHLAVAAAVASGRADCALGIAAAAQALGLDFIPLFEEPYELVLTEEVYSSPLFQAMMKILHLQEFQAMVASLPGYNTSHMGNISAELDIPA